MLELPARGYQTRVLTARYRDVWLGDAKSLLLLVGQAPLIGWLCTIVWGSLETDTTSLHFCLCLAAMWFGCIDACREVVKERAVLERERCFGLGIVPYVASKMIVLGALALVQVVALQVAVEWEIALRGPLLVETLALWLAALAGVGLGLAVSALSRREERAVGAIPLILMPQILFSEFAVPEEYFSDTVAFVEKLMPVRWAYQIFKQAAALEPEWGLVVLSVLVLGVYAFALAALSALALVPRREV